MLTGDRCTSTWNVKVACYDRQSEWCMRTHYICHSTVPFPALSHIPSPLLHTSPTHPPPTSTPSTTTAGQTQHSHLRRMNNTLATNTRANRSLSHEPKTRSPPPPSLPAQQAAQAIHSSPSALLSTSSAHCSTSPSYAHREQDPVSLVPNSRARRCCSCRRARDTSRTAFPLRALQAAFGRVFALRTLKYKPVDGL